MKTTLILERFDKRYHLLEKKELISKSFLLQLLQLLYCAHAQLNDAGPQVMTDISNVARNIDTRVLVSSATRTVKSNFRVGSGPGGSGMYCFHGRTDAFGNGPLHPELATIVGDKIGIQVGTGAVAVTPTDYALGSRIAHGDGAGELEYSGCELLYLSFSDPNGEFTIRRYFTNNSGGGITVNEVGIYAVGASYADTSSWPFCIARDLTGGVAVADTEILRVSYVPQITV